MKKSRRYLLGTLATLLVIPVALVAANRILESQVEPVSVIRTASADLGALRDFDRIEIRGDFRVEIVYQQEHSVDYMPVGTDQGDFIATRVDDLLLIRGGGHLADGHLGRRVGSRRLPARPGRP